MKVTQPKVHILGYTQLHVDGYDDFLRDIGARGKTGKEDWNPVLLRGWNQALDAGAGKLVEVAGRTCYMSFGTGLNKNVTKTTEGTAAYINNVVKQGHGSVLEHASVTVALTGISRVVTHELVRHRAGTAFSQLSGRYVLPEGIEVQKFSNFYDPRFAKLRNLASQMEDALTEVADSIAQETCFGKKKTLTSDLRKFLPGGGTTVLVMTGNMRAWRHIIKLRTSPHAEEGIRDVMNIVYRKLSYNFPMFFQDATEDSETKEVSFAYSC